LITSDEKLCSPAVIQTPSWYPVIIW
jgi:hypothetical protein